MCASQRARWLRGLDICAILAIEVPGEMAKSAPFPAPSTKWPSDEADRWNASERVAGAPPVVPVFAAGAGASVTGAWHKGTRAGPPQQTKSNAIEWNFSLVV